MKNLGKYENPKVKKAWKISTILVCIFVFIPCLTIATFGILHLCGVANLKDEETHIYEVKFYDEETQFVYYQENIIRGGKFKFTYKPSREGYEFRGWDTNHNSFPNIIPSRAFRNISARALWVPERSYSFRGNK